MSPSSFTMLRRLASVLATPSLVLAVVSATPAAAGAADTQVTKFKLRGLTVTASGQIPSSDPCLQDTLVDLWAGTADAGLRVYISQWSYNRCTQVGAFQYGSAAPTTYKVLGSLASAHIVATVPLQTDSGDPAGTVHVDNTWTATAPAVRETETETESYPGGYMHRYSFKGTFRLAEVTGSAPLTEGRILRANVLSITVWHG
jgi:hypothetical protein